MHIKLKILTCGVTVGLLAVSPAVWSENGCVAPECDQMKVQLKLMKSQINASHSDIKKLETALTFVRQNLNALQSGNARKPVFITTANHLQRTGRGNRKRNAYPN